MYRRITTLLITLITLVATARAGDKGDLVFTDTIHDFGEVAASAGYITCSFEFVNESDSAIFILGALSSCGCTIPDYPREAIEPRQHGEVRVTYDTLGRPAGPFDKTIQLIVGNDRRRIVLRVRGNAVESGHKPATFL